MEGQIVRGNSTFVIFGPMERAVWKGEYRFWSKEQCVDWMV